MKNNTKTIIIALAAAAILGALFWMGSPNGNQQSFPGAEALSLTSEFSAEEPFFDFGTISMADGDVNYDFKIKNNAPGPVTIKRIYTSCMCTTAYLTDGSEQKGPFGMPGHAPNPAIDYKIDPGKELTVRAIFNPLAHGPAGIGQNDRTVYVESESGAVLQLNFTAFVTP